jgi:hypothetical protein
MTIPTFHRLALLAPLATVFVAAAAGAPHAREGSTFVIAAASGYGVEDCLAEGGECGRVVADAWCEAHGHREALKFGRSEGDGGAKSEAPELRPYFITCGE